MGSPNTTEEDSQPTARSARPPATIDQSPRRGRRYETLGWIALTLGAAGIGVQVGDATTSDLVIWIVGVVLTVVGGWAVLRGRQHLAPVLPSLQSLPPGERTVLFLRAFNADATFFRPVAARFYWLRSVFTGQPTTAADLQTEEQQIATAVASFGRMVALGNPSETLPPLGAQRAYADDHTWQAEVLGALDRAELVVLAIGATRNLSWEVQQVVGRNNPTRLVLTVGHDRDAYTYFQQALGAQFPRGLPDYPAVSIRQKLLKARSVRAVIWFDADWTPHVEVLAARVPIINFARRTQRTVRRSLGEVFHRAGLPKRLTPTTPRPSAVPVGIALIVAMWVLPFVLFAAAIRVVERLMAGAIDESSGLADLSSSISAIFYVSVLAALLPWFVILILWMWRVWRGGPLAIGIARIWGVWLTALLATLMFWPMHSGDDSSSRTETSYSEETSSPPTIWDDSDGSSGPWFPDDFGNSGNNDYTGSPDEFGNDGYTGFPDDTGSSDQVGPLFGTDDQESTSTSTGGVNEIPPLIPLGLILCAFPLGATWLLTRREVREWVDSRL